MTTQHIVNISGGKDSAACYLLAIESGRPFRAVTADTGHEAPETYEWIARLRERTGGPEVELVRADFSDRIAKKRAYVQNDWPNHGIPDDVIAAALDVLHATGNPFLDLCIWKGRFPSTRARFCTEFLKSRPIHDQVLAPAVAQGAVVRWQGERREESIRRALLPRWHRVGHRQRIFRPVLDWTADQVFELHRKHGLEPNPLYKMGMSRVGCLPCIMAGKGEILQIAKRFPEAVEKLERWEAIVAKASKRGLATFFGPDKTPEGAEQARRAKAGEVSDRKYPGVRQIVDWSKTTRGGRQYDLIAAMDDSASCSSEYGLCE